MDRGGFHRQSCREQLVSSRLRRPHRRLAFVNAAVPGEIGLYNRACTAHAQHMHSPCTFTGHAQQSTCARMHMHMYMYMHMHMHMHSTCTAHASARTAHAQRMHSACTAQHSTAQNMRMCYMCTSINSINSINSISTISSSISTAVQLALCMIAAPDSHDTCKSSISKESQLHIRRCMSWHALCMCCACACACTCAYALLCMPRGFACAVHVRACAMHALCKHAGTAPYPSK